MPRLKTRRVLAGLYVVTDADGHEWYVELRDVDPAYGGGREWFATSRDTREVLDPLPTLRDVKRALGEQR